MWLASTSQSDQPKLFDWSCIRHVLMSQSNPAVLLLCFFFLVMTSQDYILIFFYYINRNVLVENRWHCNVRGLRHVGPCDVATAIRIARHMPCRRPRSCLPGFVLFSADDVSAAAACRAVAVVALLHAAAACNYLRIKILPDAESLFLFRSRLNQLSHATLFWALLLCAAPCCCGLCV